LSFTSSLRLPYNGRHLFSTIFRRCPPGGYVASDSPQITQLLKEWQAGNPAAGSELFETLMPDLRRLAARCFRGERPGHTLQPTALLHEAFIRLAKSKNIEWRDRGHFFAIAARIMRRELIDHARKRPKAAMVPMDGLPDRLMGRQSMLELAVAIDTLLDELERESPQQAHIVELKVFLGLTDEEAADALNLNLRTLQREWSRARRWLFQKLE
jgi:RNA polymerase sigma factor (TIGR02999 family)